MMKIDDENWWWKLMMKIDDENWWWKLMKIMNSGRPENCLYSVFLFEHPTNEDPKENL